MSEHTYAGRTLAEIRTAAESMRCWKIEEARLIGEDEICEFGTEHDGEWYPLGTVDGQTYTSNPADDLVIAQYIVTANPDTVLDMVERIAELEAQQLSVLNKPATVAVPPGYKLCLIPKESTDEFNAACSAAFEESKQGTGPCGVFMAAHRAMLAAAPKPAAVAVPDGWQGELLDWVSACQSAHHIDNTPGHRFGGLGSNLEENRAAVVEYVAGLLTPPNARKEGGEA